MDNIKIKNESLPTRCETCHQTDCFDPQNNICSRCTTIDDEEVNKPVKRKLTLDYGDIGLICGVISGVICGIVAELLHPQSQIHTTTSSSNFWAIIGLALLGAVWGAATGETVKKIRNHKKT